MSQAIAFYARTSLLHPDGLEQQLAALHAYAAAQGWPAEAAALYIDERVTDGDLDRPGLNRLRDAVRQGAVATVVAEETATFTQFAGGLLALEEELAAHGATVVYARMTDAELARVRASQARLRDPQTGALAQFKEAIAKADHRQYMERVAAGFESDDEIALAEAG